jgi:hypothetical protein
LRVNSFSRRRGRRTPRRYTSAPRREESSRALSLQIMLGKQIDHSSLRAR